ncbi:MAG: HEAT repeat domain-containing protein [Calothrix sp. MO_192.B10]|nr:HEAT repeat domain-containing protein [Calothrix sp. MO_192.B10]
MSSTVCVSKKYQQVDYTPSSSVYEGDVDLIVKETIKVERYVLESEISKLSTSMYLCSSKSISEFEDRIEHIRDQLLEGYNKILTKEDIQFIGELVKSKSNWLYLQYIARLIEPLLEIESDSEKAALMIIELLKHPAAQVRYAALEAISFSLGEVEIADKLLTEAKELLRDEKTTFVRKYLESL